MSKNNKEHIELLQKIFDNTNTWLHFAEGKNAALIAFNVTMAATITEMGLLKNYLLLTSAVLIGLILSTITALWSFKPLNGNIKTFPNNGISENLLHYAYISSLEPDEYLQKLYEKYWDRPGQNRDDFQQLELDYCKEITENSKITVRKQSCFKRSFYIILTALLLLIIVLICA